MKLPVLPTSLTASRECLVLFRSLADSLALCYYSAVLCSLLLHLMATASRPPHFSTALYFLSIDTAIFIFYTLPSLFSFFFFLNDPAPPEISPFPLPDPLPIKGSSPRPFSSANAPAGSTSLPLAALTSMPVSVGTPVAKVPAKASRSSRRRMRPRRPPLCS